MSRWIALYSQTGDELRKLQKLLNGRAPDMVLTTNPKKYVDCTRTARELHYQVEAVLLEQLRPGDIVTLHGYLFILSDKVLSIPGVKFYNGHPGLVTLYPELKGKDPQQKIFNSFYPVVGCIIHEVTSEVDSGPILMTSQITVDFGFYTRSFDQVINDIKYISLGLWRVFLEGVL